VIIFLDQLHAQFDSFVADWNIQVANKYKKATDNVEKEQEAENSTSSKSTNSAAEQQQQQNMDRTL
jgi:hypothetical protein